MLKLVQVGRLIHAGSQKSLHRDVVKHSQLFIPSVTQFRTKYNKKSSSQNDSDSDDDDEDLLGNDKSLTRTTVNSLRMDLIIKAGLGMARNKVETKFYENKIRLNGKKIAKKSVQMGIGDEVDVIKGLSPQNDEHIVVGRIEIVSAKAKEESISVILRKSKSLIIENYPGSNAWKGGSGDSNNNNAV